MSQAPAHLLHVFATFTAAGPQLRTVALMDGAGDELRHTVVSMDGRTDAFEHLNHPERVRLLPAPEASGALGSVRAFRALLRTEAPDVLCTYNWGAIEAALAARTLGRGHQHIHHEDGFRPDEVDGLKTRRNVFRRLALGRSRALVVVSEGLRQMAERHWGVRGERLHLVPNGIPVASYGMGAPAGDSADVRKRLGIPGDALVIGYVGHLRPEKNPRRLIEAVAAMEDRTVHVLVLGDGPEREGMESDLVRLDLGSRVHLAGFQENTPPFYSAMDLFALSSDSEQMPVALIEAMASRLPVAATDVGDARTMLPAAQGEFVVERSQTALAQALDRLTANPRLRAELGDANRREAEERFSFDAMLATYRRLYAAAAGS